jgi:hypothetical protein
MATPTSAPRADLSSFSGAKAAVAIASANRSSVGSCSYATAMDFLSPAARDFASAAKVNLNLSHARASRRPID